MDSLLLVFLLLGATPDGSPNETAGTPIRAHAVASARILRGEVIRWGEPATREARPDSGNIFQPAMIRSAGKVAGVDGRTIQLQEFH